MPRNRSIRSVLIGNRAFYAMVIAVVFPIIIQNAITNFVNLLDNIMVGRVGTNQMAGVSIANQILFISSLCVFGGMSGAGIFAAQFHGAGEARGVQSCFHYKIRLAIVLTVLTVLICTFWGDGLISLYLNEKNDPERVRQTLSCGRSYLTVMLFGIAPFALTQALSSTLRETGETRLPMVAGILAVLSNLALNYLLIYDHFGRKGLGVRGAALATVISRFIELGVVCAIALRNRDRYPFLKNVWKNVHIPGALARRITVKGMPLLINEALWSLGVATLMRCYSLRGLDVVSAMNISSTVSNLFNVVFLSMGNASAIIIGQMLGSGSGSEARDQAWKLSAFSIFLCVATGLLLGIAAPFIPAIYNTEPAIRALATRFLWVAAACMPVFSFCNSSYFILRAGGKTLITFAFDSGFSWIVSIPLALLLVHKTDLSIVSIYLIVQLADLIKCAVGFVLLKKGVWIQTIIDQGA